MSYVHVSRRGSALWARLDRPERANALGPEIVAGLTRWLADGAADPAVRTLVVTGTGRAFCPGADVRASAALRDADSRLAFLESGRDLMTAIEESPLPVIAAVNGAAFAGGLELVLACDLVIASQHAVFGDLHLPHGRIPAWGGSARLVSAVGAARAARMLLLGERFCATEMTEFGLVSRTVQDDLLVETVDEVARTLAGYDRTAVAEMTALIRSVRRQAPQEALRTEWAHFRRHFTGHGDPGAVTIRR
ncbi:enoyl-CoA hydratase/isomerase family protein [Streptosporangium sp. NPDC049248]|uniref:enoyl-CoA hydratase/isomerase family protein n=1 Tax=Streptosporangium sp. NPDC049248 TaxID=3155651 RepID=UPI00343D7EDD